MPQETTPPPRPQRPLAGKPPHNDVTRPARRTWLALPFPFPRPPSHPDPAAPNSRCPLPPLPASPAPTAASPRPTNLTDLAS